VNMKIGWYAIIDTYGRS